MSRSNQAFVLIATALVFLMQGSQSGRAQDRSELRSELGADQAALQRNYIKRLRQHALKAGRKGSPTYNAVLREGLSRLGGGLNQVTRGRTTDLTSIPPETIVPKPIAADKGKTAGRRLEALVAAAEVGTRVIGGQAVTSLKTFINTVALENSSNDVACTGVYIAPGAVLTAAHCVCDLQLLPGQSSAGKNIVFGTAIRDGNSKRVQIDTQRTALFDANYCEVHRTPQALCLTDLAVVRFTEPIPIFQNPPLTPDAAVVARASDFSATLQRPDGLYIVVGYGATRSPDNGPFPINESREKNYGFVPALQTCSRVAGTCPSLQTDPYCFQGREIVLYDQRGSVDTCNGDSGGPVFIKENGSSPANRLLGITSRSASRQVTCGAGGIYTLVQTNRVFNWLKNGLNLDVVR